jgi:hypothetical protein
MDKTQKKAEKEKGFKLILSTLNKGHLLRQIDEAVTEVSIKTRNIGKQGKVTLELSFDADPKSEGSQLYVTAKIAAKPPQTTPNSNLFFVGPDGELQREDPNQTKFGFAEEE